MTQGVPSHSALRRAVGAELRELPAISEDRAPRAPAARVPGHGVDLLLVTLYEEERGGERPIAVTWRLHRPMPPEVFQQGSVISA